MDLFDVELAILRRRCDPELEFCFAELRRARMEIIALEEQLAEERMSTDEYVEWTGIGR